MNWDIISGNWKQLKGQVRSQWGKLTDSDIDLIGGKKDELIGKLQARYGYAKDEAERQIDVWSNDLKVSGSDTFGKGSTESL